MHDGRQKTTLLLSLECIFQVCVGRMIISNDGKDSTVKREMQAKYTEFLGLPLDIEVVNPLTFVVAHRVHGFQIRMGWLLRPTSLKDRVDEDNNILIETRSSNYLKLNFSESWYPNLRDQILNINIPLKFADESINPRPVSARLEKLYFYDEVLGKGFIDGEDDEDDEEWQEALRGESCGKSFLRTMGLLAETSLMEILTSKTPVYRRM